ncbi:MAG: PAS domain-containing protein [Desulfobacterales bacterium]|nr:PAS domain-containing protein [Desulfobacterales bacterium]
MLQSVFDGISDPLIMFDRNLSVKVLNKAAAGYYQVELQKVIGKPCYQGFRGRSTPCEGCDIPSAVLSGEVVAFERQGTMNPDRFEQVVVYPLREEAGAIIRISDITEAKLMQRQMIQSEKMASLGLLVSGIAHEINNPNNFITFNIPILRDYLQGLMPILDDYGKGHRDFELFGMSYPEFREDMFKLLDNVEHGSDRINSIVSDLREFSKRKDKRERVWSNIKQVIERVVAICRGEIKKKVKSFEMEIPEDLPEILTDPHTLEQVLINLLINAVHAADKKDSWIRLSVAPGDTQRDHLIIEVSDNGRGMDEKTREKIFDPFFTTKTHEVGTGLGLYVCHNLVEGLGGRIEVESEQGKGSTFRVILPDEGKRDLKLET